MTMFGIRQSRRLAVAAIALGWLLGMAPALGTWLTGTLSAQKGARESARDAAGTVLSLERSRYLVGLGDDGQPRIRVAISLPPPTAGKRSPD